jgi:Na+/melibiose symporter-like transporter
MILLYYTAQTVLDISSSALGSEMTLDYDERSTLATYKNYFGLLATVAISPTLVLVAYFGGWFENPDYGWSCTLAVYTIVALIFIIILWRTTRGYERHRGESGFKLSFYDIKVLFKNRATRIVALIFGIGIFSNTINYSIQVYYYTNYVEMTEAQIAAVTMVFGVTSIIGAWVTDVLMKKFGKKMAWIIGVGSEGIFLAVMVGLLINPGQIGLIYALVVLMAVGNAAIYQVPWAMIPDCVDVTELSTGIVKTSGWLADSKSGYIETAKRMANIGVETIIYTDIARDGTLSGPNFEHLESLKNAVPSKIIASGGIRDIADIQALCGMGLYGAICGKSIYQGSLDLRNALEFVAKAKKIN